MIPTETLPKGPPEHPILDFWALRRQAIETLEALSDGQWTDFNAHDPGITILEVLCYGLTDLGYRIFHDIGDIAGGARGPAYDDGLPDAVGALTSHAVTLNDLRRVALDVGGVRNAWIEPVTEPDLALAFDPGAGQLTVGTPEAGQQPIRLRGLHRVLLERSAREATDGTTLRVQVAERLHAHRGLGMDFDDIVVLSAQPVHVVADLDIADAANPEALMRTILEALARYFSPGIAAQSLADRQATGEPLERALDGPWLDRGLIRDADLAASPRRTAVHRSDIIRLLSEVQGVRAVRRVMLADRGAVPDPEVWSLPVRPMAAPVLDVGESRIQLYSQGTGRFAMDPARMSVAVDERRARTAQAGAVPETTGRRRDLATHYPLADEFPNAYGLQALAPDAPPARRAEAAQLSAYLAFFDQAIGDQLALLDAVPRLLTLSDDAPVAFPRAPLPEAAHGPPRTRPEAGDAPAPSPADWRRREVLVDHLLARFGESFAAVPRTASAARPTDAAPAAVADKEAFFRALPEMARGRGLGRNYLEEAAPASGLERRIAAKLALDPEAGERLLLIEHILLRPTGADADQGLPFLENAARGDPFSLQITVLMPAATPRLAQADVRAFAETVVREEVPAHLHVTLRWIEDLDDFAAIEAAYRQWLGLRRAFVLAQIRGAEGRP